MLPISGLSSKINNKARKSISAYCFLAYIDNSTRPHSVIFQKTAFFIETAERTSTNVTIINIFGSAFLYW
jgi:hypothetical protein